MKAPLLRSIIAGLGIAGFFVFQNLSEVETENQSTEAEQGFESKIERELFGPAMDDVFFYDLGPRFGGIKKSLLEKAEKLEDVLDPDFTQAVKSYERLELRTVDMEGKFSMEPIVSEEGQLSAEQWQFLRELPYNSNLYFKIDCYEYYQNSETLIFNTHTPHLTVVPEVQAQAKMGNEAFVRQIQIDNYPNVAGLQREDLRPAKMFLHITKEGILDDIILDKGTGLPQVDLKLIDLIKSHQNDWIPARNAKGEAVNQSLVFFFGLPGC